MANSYLGATTTGTSTKKESLAPYIYGGLLASFIGIVGYTMLTSTNKEISTNLFNWTDSSPITKEDFTAALDLIDEKKIRVGEDLDREKIKRLQSE